MNIKPSFFALLLTLFLSLTCTQAFAQTGEQGFDFRLGLAFSGLVYDVSVDSGLKIGDVGVTSKKDADPYDDMAGINGSASLGYRWKYAGVYIDANVGGLWWMDEAGKQYDDASVLASFFLSAHGFLPIDKKFELEGALGVGGALSDGDRPFQGDGDVNPNYEKPALIFDKHGNPTTCPAIHFGLGFTAYLTNYFGIGYFFDYNLLINSYKYSYNHGMIAVKADVVRLLHQINTGVQVRFRF